MKERVEIEEFELEAVNGGAIGYNPNGDGTYTMIGEFTGEKHIVPSLAAVMDIAQYSAHQPNTLDGEKDIMAYAKKYFVG